MNLLQLSSKLLRPFLTYAYCGVIFQDDAFLVHTIFIKNNVKKAETKEFPIGANDIPIALVSYINELRENYSFHYIATNYSSASTGCIAGISEADYQVFNLDIRNFIVTNVEGAWSSYIRKKEVEAINNKFKDTDGFDFIFSNDVLNYFLLTKSVQKKPTLYLFYSYVVVNVYIFQARSLLYSSNFIYREEAYDMLTGVVESDEVISRAEELIDEIEEEEEPDIEEEDEKYEPENLDAFSVDEDSLFEDVENIYDDDSSNFSDDEDAQEEGDESKKEAIISQKDSMLCEFIQNCIEEYYKSDKNESDFLSNAVVFHATDSIEKVKEFVSEDLMMKTKTVKINLCEVIAEASINEVKQSVL